MLTQIGSLINVVTQIIVFKSTVTLLKKKKNNKKNTTHSVDETKNIRSPPLKMI